MVPRAHAPQAKVAQREDGRRVVSGKCFVVKDNIDTDQIIPAEVRPRLRPAGRLLRWGRGEGACSALRCTRLSANTSPQYLTLVPSKPDEYEKLGSYALIGLPDDQYPTRECLP